MMKIYKSIPLLFLLLNSTSVSADEWKSDEFNCAVTFPAGWVQQPSPTPMVKVLYASSDSSQKATVAIGWEEISDSPVSDRYIVGLKRGMTENKAATILSERRTTIDDVPAVEFVWQVANAGVVASMKQRSVIAGGRTYVIVMTDIRQSITSDPEADQFLDSFHFLKPPPKAATSAGSRITKSSEAYRAGYIVGQITAVLVFILLVIGGIVAVIKIARRSGRKPPPLPPSAG